MTLKTLSSFLYACPHPHHMLCKIHLGSPGVGHWRKLVNICSHRTFTFGSWRAQKQEGNMWKTFSSRRWRYTWKGSICWSTLLEMIILVNWLRHSAYQCRADTLYVTEITSSYCCPIKNHRACCTVHSAMHAACFSNRLQCVTWVSNSLGLVCMLRSPSMFW